GHDGTGYAIRAVSQGHRTRSERRPKFRAQGRELGAPKHWQAQPAPQSRRDSRGRTHSETGIPLSAMDCGGRAARAKKRRGAAAAAAKNQVMAAMENATSAKVKIRRARRADAEWIAQLSGELGYPPSAAQITARLRQLTPTS